MTSRRELQTAATTLTVTASTAEELMTPNPLSIRQNASIKEAAAFLTDRGISAAPVIDDAGRAIGVLSRADIVLHHRQQVEYVPAISNYYERADLATRPEERLPAGFQIENVDPSQVRDIMTPVVFAVSLKDSARNVIARMVDEKVHRLFVLDESGVLVGVISALDVLRRIQ
jgi:CBS-domain-containing membrane protein